LEIAPLVWVPADADEKTLQAKLGELQERMNKLHRLGEEWRATTNRKP
jgi:hypothetical protein